MLRVYIIILSLFCAIEPLITPAYAIDKGLQTFRMGTGPSAGSSYFTGIELAGFISKPAGSISCESSGLCGVPGLIASTQTQSGFIDGITALERGSIDALLVPANVAYWAYEGKALFSEHGAYPDLRAFASLRPEFLHIIVRADKSIGSVEDLRGRAISLGWLQSGIPALAEAVLARYGIETDAVDAFYFDTNESLDALAAGTIDAAFLLEAGGAENVAQLFRSAEVELLHLSGLDLLALSLNPSLDTAIIKAGVYGDNPAVTTLSIDLLWLTHSHVSAEIIEKIIRAVWNNDKSTAFLKWSHLQKRERAILHLQNGTIDGVPLHLGAKDYFLGLERLPQAQAASNN